MQSNDVAETLSETLLPDLLRRCPRARTVFDKYGLRGCGGPLGPRESVAFFARAHGVDEAVLVAELREAIEQPAPQPSPLALPGVADTIYRRFFIGAIAVMLTAGGTWGTWLLWRIGINHDFTAIPVYDVNAHAHAQIFGWLSLFIMGFAYQAFPRLWHTTLPAPRLAATVFGLMATGVVTRTIGMAAAGAWPSALPLAMFGGAIEIAAIVLFVAQIVTACVRARPQVEPYLAFIMAALGWMVVMSVASLWHTQKTLTAGGTDELVWYVATYQGPLRDLQIHGFALFMIIGVSLRMLPGVFGLPAVPARRAWLAFVLLVAGVGGEVGLFVAFRLTGRFELALLLVVAWLTVSIACALVAWPWKLWRPFAEPDRSAKYIRAAWGWLFIGQAMLLLLPVYLVAANVGFSHAYYGAVRHAVTVGFISLMIVGFSSKVVPTLNGVDPATLSPLTGEFVLLNVGCFLRVTMQVLTDTHPVFYSLVGISGVLEMAGFAWWGYGLVKLIAAGRHAWDVVPPTAGQAPARIEAQHRVADVLAWFPAAEAVLLAHGFTPLAQPLLRRTLARGVTLRQAAALRGVGLEGLLDELNQAGAP